MRTCSRCPCPLYSPERGVCYHCWPHHTSPPNTHPTCIRCDRLICSEHGGDLSIRASICRSCMNQPEPDHDIYIPAYLLAQRPRQDTFACRIRKSLKLVPAETHKDCAICTSSLNSTVAELACAHVFHIDCITPWFRKNLSCPLCRQEHLLIERSENVP